MNEAIIKSENVWNTPNNVVKDINIGRAALQTFGFVDKEPTLVVPEHIYAVLEETGNFPHDDEVTYLDALLYNSLVESVISIKSTENTAYLWVDRCEHPESRVVSDITYETGRAIITDINLSSEQTKTEEEK